MNQIKYILRACLILLMIFMGIFLYTTFPESGLVTQSNQTADIITSASAVPVSSEGGKIFKQNCASCHALDRELVGPALHNVAQRGPWAEDSGNLKKWIKNPSQFTATNSYAKDLKRKYGNFQMPPQAQLSEKEIDEVIAYITRQ